MLLSKYKRKPEAWNKHVVLYYESEAIPSSTETAHPFRLIPWLLELDSSTFPQGNLCCWHSNFFWGGWIYLFLIYYAYYSCKNKTFLDYARKIFPISLSLSPPLQTTSVLLPCFVFTAHASIWFIITLIINFLFYWNVNSKIWSVVVNTPSLALKRLPSAQRVKRAQCVYVEWLNEFVSHLSNFWVSSVKTVTMSVYSSLSPQSSAQCLTLSRYIVKAYKINI